MNVGSLFAGIGGFELGLERAGFEIEWQVEIDPYCRAVLERHFPRARRFEDVREVGAANLAEVDVICGGFPCQDLSSAGKGAGIDGARSGLWSEFARIVRELRPRYVLVENVPALLTGKGKRWDRAPIGRVLGDLAEIGYDAEWARLSAREFGAPHLRQRVWIVAYPGLDADPDTDAGGLPGVAELDRPAAAGKPEGPFRQHPDRLRDALPDTDGVGCPQGLLDLAATGQPPGEGNALGRCAGRGREGGRHGQEGEPWSVEPDVGRVAHGVPRRVDRLAALGNALVPQIAEWIGRRILDHEAAAMTNSAVHRGVHPGVHRGVHPGVRRDSRQTRHIPRRGAGSAGPKNLRSTRHSEARS